MDYVRKKVAIRHLKGIEARVLRKNRAGGSLAVEILVTNATYKAYKVGDKLNVMPYEVTVIPE